MARRRATTQHNEEEVVMNFTSMLDVVFNILFFFVATFSPPAAERTFDINLPPPKAGQAGEVAGNDLPSDEEAVLFNDITLTLSSGPNGELGGIKIEQRPVEGGLGRLTAEIRKAAEAVGGIGNKKKLDAAVIVAPPGLKYQHVIEVMDACRAAEITKINFAEAKAAPKK